MSTDPKVIIVDDDEAVRESLKALLESHDFTVAAFSSAVDFLAENDHTAAGCLLTDVRMPGIDGLELQEKVSESFPNLAVVVMTGHAEVPLAVRAMKAGAIDFIEKPFLEDILVDAVRRAMEYAAQSQQHQSDAGAASARLALLTPRERDVLNGLMAGYPNKTIAYDLRISPRTVEIHRARVMEKMQARSLSSLIRIALVAGVAPS